MVALSTIAFSSLLSITDGRPYDTKFRKGLRSDECFQKARSRIFQSRALKTPHTEAARAFLQDAAWERSTIPTPGVGMEPDLIEPFERVLNDGYMPMGCMKDAMYEHGDKYGNNKFSYKYGPAGNVSIVHYSDHVPKEDRETMTEKVCFNFCRTIPGMYAFGIVNGNDCYCGPYVKEMASDDSTCDVPCEGDPATMCGSKKKASVWDMHHCDQTASNLVEAADAALLFERFIPPMVEEINTIVLDKMQNAGEKLQKMFGAAGDPTASNLLQNVKVFAGKLQHLTDDAAKMPAKVTKLRAEVVKFTGNPFTDQKDVTEAEDLTQRLKDSVPEAHKYADEAHRMFMLTQRGKEDEHLLAGSQYYSLMYFVDKKYQMDRATCGGDFDVDPLFSTSPDACAAACDDDRECVGFSFYDVNNLGTTCFLAHRFKSVQVYTECHDNDEVAEHATMQDHDLQQKHDFLQERQKASFLRPKQVTRQSNEDQNVVKSPHDFLSRIGSVLSAGKHKLDAWRKKTGSGSDAWKAKYEDLGQGFGSGPDMAFLKSCTTHEVSRDQCAEICLSWDNCQGFSEGLDDIELDNTCIIFPAIGERDSCPEATDGKPIDWMAYWHGDDEELVETFMGEDMDHMPVPFHTFKKKEHDHESGPQLHAGCRCDEEFFEPTKTCFKKCAILTNGEYANRSNTNACCRAEPCHAAGHTHTNGFGCEGYGVDGDGNCPARPSISRVTSKVCTVPAPVQVTPPPLRPSVEVKKPKEHHEEREEEGLEVKAPETEVPGSLGKLVDHALEDHHENHDEEAGEGGHGLVMCFAKFSKFSGTKPKVEVTMAKRCYTGSAEED